MFLTLKMMNFIVGNDYNQLKNQKFVILKENIVNI